MKQALSEYGIERTDVMTDRLSSVVSLYSFVPNEQEDKLFLIKTIRNMIERKRGALKATTLEKLEKWEDKLAITEPVNVDDVPAWVVDQFRDSENRPDRFVVVKTLGAKADIENATRIRDAFNTLRHKDAERPTAASFYVLPNVMDALHRDGPALLFFAFGVLLVTAFLLFSGGPFGSDCSGNGRHCDALACRLDAIHGLESRPLQFDCHSHDCWDGSGPCPSYAPPSERGWTGLDATDHS